MNKESLKTVGMMVLVGAIYFSPMPVAIYMNRKFEDIGEGYMVREIDEQRQFFMRPNLLYVDEKMDGSLDRVLINMPVGPFMGGPGYKLIRTEKTTEDSVRFERINYFFNQQQKGEDNRRKE